MDSNGRRPTGFRRILIRLICNYRDTSYTLGPKLQGNVPGHHVTVHRLSTGQGNGIVVQNFISNVDPRSYGGSNS